MNYNFNFCGKVAVVTGAAGGIGLEVVKGLLENGADIVAVDYNREVLEAQVAELKKQYKNQIILAVYADLTKADDIEAMTEKIAEHFDSVDILINNAGTGCTIRSINETPENWSRVVDLNLTASFFVSKSIATKFMIPQKSGRIVNMCSLSAFMGIPKSVSYSASKGAILQMTKSLAAEWARFSIAVNCVCPGFVDTPLIAEEKSDERWLTYVTMRNPMRRLANPEDIVGPTLFLASDLAQYVNGTSLIVDGGYSCSG